MKLNPFIASTAKDYAMTYNEVKVFYNKYGITPLFYGALEDFIKNRANK